MPSELLTHAMDIEPLVTLSTELLTPAGRTWLSEGGFGATVYPNEYGGFMFVGYPQRPDFDPAVPTEITRIAEQAWHAGLMWVKFDPDGLASPAWEELRQRVVERQAPMNGLSMGPALPQGMNAEALIDLLARLDQWRDTTGGWEADVWKDLQVIVRRLRPDDAKRGSGV